MADFTTLAHYFQTYGVMDFLLPFLLVFTIVFAVMQKTKILGDKKQYNVIIALILGLLFVIPHVIGSYPLGYDPVQVMNDALPSISLVAIAAIMLLLLMGIFGARWADAAMPFIAFAAVAFVAYIFGSALDIWTGPSDIFSWWTAETTELMLIILVFGLIVWFITKEPKQPGDRTALGKVGDVVKKLVEKHY
jgi:hypothetical protein